MEQTEKSSLSYIFDFYKTLKSHNITLVYEGEITNELTRAFTTLAESNMLKEENSGMVQKRVFYVMVECLQNLSRHAEETKHEQNIYSTRGVFIVTRDENEYRIITGNYIENSKVSILKSKLDHVNSLSKDQLHELYIQQLRDGSISDKGGAGLGFIDIARKTGRKLDFYFHPIDDKNSFFIMTSTIPRA
jgi:hypothetical protein